MRRFFTEPENIKSNIAEIIEDAAHISRVLRMNPGDKILLFDGTGKEYTAVLKNISAKICTAEILSDTISLSEPKTKVSIYQALPKSGKMENIIQKSVELGVYEIIPVITDRIVSKLDGGKKENEKISRWNKVSTEAAKQCGRGILPKVLPPLSFENAINTMCESSFAIMPYEELGHSGVSNLKDVLKSCTSEKISVIIGPEGGFSDKESEYAKKQNVNLVGLGKRILRTETVAPAIISAIMYEKNEF